MNPGFPRPVPAQENATGGSSAPTPPSIPDHTLLQLVGKGSYGEVWLGRNVMGTLRAVKVVHRRAFTDERPYEREFGGIQRFEPLSRTHEGLVDILQVGRNDADGYFYYVMELADNSVTPGTEGTQEPRSLPPGVIPPMLPYAPRTLAGDIARRGALPTDECLTLALSLAGALAHLHRHGLVHRDIKPANIIFVGGVAKLADIGLVSEAGGSRSYVGTEGYIPPEGPGTRQADLYSLGKVIYEASAGRDRSDFPAIPVALTRGEFGKRFRELNAVFIKACANDPQDRYASAEELQADLALLQIGKSVRSLHTLERRLRLMARAGLVAAAIAALALGAYGFAKRQARLDRENLLRIERAEKEARAQLRQALFSQAQALRRSGQSGQRFESLGAIAKTVLIETPATAAQLVELRNEAIGALSLADGRLTRPPLLKDRATNLAVSASFDRYAIGDETGRVQVRALSDDRLLAELIGPRDPVTFVHHFSPDDRFLPVLYKDGLLRVWDLAGLNIVLSVQPEHELKSFDFSPDGRSLAVVDSSLSLKLHELPSGTLLRRDPPGVQRLRPRFSPDGKRLGISSQSLTTARLQEVETGRTLAELPHPRGVQALSWSPDGQFVATGCGDAKVYLWHVNLNGEPDPHPGAAAPPTLEPAFVLVGHQASVIELDFHPYGQLLASAGWDGMIRLWDTANGDALVTLPATGDAMRFNRDGRFLSFYWGSERALFIAEVAGQRVYRLLRKPALVQSAKAEPQEGQYCVAFSPDDRWLASGHGDGLRLWDGESAREIAHLRGGWVRSTFFHPDGATLFACGDDGVMSWSLDAVLASRGTQPPMRLAVVGGNPYLRGCLSAQGDELAYVYHQAIRLLYSQRELEGPRGLNFVSMSPDDRWLAASTWGNNGGRLWRLPSGTFVRDFAAGQTVNIGFSPDSRWLVTGHGDAYRFWDLENGQPGRFIPRQDSAQGFGLFAFSPDGSTFACASSRTRVQLFDAASFELLATLDLPGSPMISALAFNHAGTQLAVTTATPFLQLWDLHRIREQLATLQLDWPSPPLQVPAAWGSLPRPAATPPSPATESTALPAGQNQVSLDLSPFYNAMLDKLWDQENNLAALPKGVRRLGGVDYDVRGAIRLRGRHNPDLPRHVLAIPIHRRCATLHFLQSTAWAEKVGTQIGAYIIHFADGTQHEAPIVYGRDVRNWWLTPEQHAAGAPAAVWIGSAPAAKRQGFEIHLFHSAWKNPQPDVEISHLDFVSMDTECPPFLIAITVE